MSMSYWVMLSALQGWCPWCGDHMGWGGGWGMLVFWLLLLLVVVVAVVWAVGRARAAGDAAPGSAHGRGQDRAEEIVRERYARGEIDEETYRQRLDELRRDRS